MAAVLGLGDEFQGGSMSRTLTAPALRTAAAIVVAGVLTVSPGRAVPVLAAPADANPAAPHIALDISLFETIDPSNLTVEQAHALTSGEGVEFFDLLFAGTAAPNGGAGTGLPTLPAWTPADIPGGNATGPENSRLFEVPMNELLAVRAPTRIADLAEPGILVLLGSGLLFLALLGRRFRFLDRWHIASNRNREGDRE
jgi:hypothetical protein